MNANTPYEKCKVHYCTFDEAVRICLREAISCKWGNQIRPQPSEIWELKKSDWPLLIIKAKNPDDGENLLFVNKCLPFGAAISCTHFQCFLDAVAHIVQGKTGKKLINYLDDYFICGIAGSSV